MGRFSITSMKQAIIQGRNDALKSQSDLRLKQEESSLKKTMYVIGGLVILAAVGAFVLLRKKK